MSSPYRSSEPSWVETLNNSRKINANDIDAEWEAVSASWTSEVLEGAVA